MSHPQRIVHTSGSRSNEVLKPIPPADLWAQLDSLRSADGILNKIQPPNSFTLQDYMSRYGVSRASGRTHLNRMVKQGTVEIVGRGSNNATFFALAKPKRS